VVAKYRAQMPPLCMPTRPKCILFIHVIGGLLLYEHLTAGHKGHTEQHISATAQCAVYPPGMSRASRSIYCHQKPRATDFYVPRACLRPAAVHAEQH
jgi:hypothetical protein